MSSQTIDNQNYQSKVKHDPDGPATDRQMSFLNSLLKQRQTTAEQMTQAVTEVATGQMTKARASLVIDWLLKQPKVEAPKQIEAPKVVDGEGAYVGSSGRFYSAAYKPHTNFLLFRAVAEFGDRVKFIRCYSKQARTDIETGGRRMTESEAAAFGHKWGLCVRCGRILSNPESVELGIGPICRKNTIWG